MSQLENANDFSTYPALRQVLEPGLAVAAAPVIRARMEAEFGEGSAEAYNDQLESLWGDIGNFARRAAPVVANVGGGMLQGAMAGSALGPAGIIGGALVGGAGKALPQLGGRTAGKIGAALSGVTNIAGQFSPMGRIGSAIGPAIGGLAGGAGGRGVAGAATSILNGVLGGAGGAGGPAGAISGLLQNPAASQAISGLFGGGSAMGQLTSFMSRPETQQAFAALQLGRLGRPTTPVGAARVPVPTAAFPEVLAHLADQAAAETAEWTGESEAALGYMQDAEGEYVGDPAFARDRAARVWELLNEAQAERVLESIVAPRPAPHAAPRTAEAEAESWTDWEVEAEWLDTLDALDSASGDSEWGDGESEWSDGEYEYEAEAEYAYA